jgi:tol-pal system protein YbgF
MRKLIIAAAVALCTTACATNSDMEKLQSQISDLQDQIAQLKRTASSKEEVQNVNAKIAEQTQTLLKSNAQLVTKVDTIEDRMNNMQGSIEQTNYRVDRLVQQSTQTQHDVDELKAAAAAAAARAAAAQPPAPGATTTTVPTAPPMAEVTVAPPAATSTESPVETYQAAYRDYQRGNYDLAISGFRDVVTRYPKSDLADNAAYWIGESLYSQKKYREAIAQFDSVVTNYPKSDKVASALLKKGYAYIQLGQKNMGIVQLQYVVHEHPKSPEAAKARDELKRLGVE